MRHGTSTPVIRYGLGGVQSTPRVMRGAPVAVASVRDLALSKRKLAVDTLGGLSDQGIARTLGTLANDTIGADDLIEMPEECARPGEILLAPGVCGPDPRQPLNPYATPPQLAPTRASSTMTAPAAAAARAGSGLSRNELLALAAGVALVLYLSKGTR